MEGPEASDGAGDQACLSRHYGRRNWLRGSKRPRAARCDSGRKQLPLPHCWACSDGIRTGPLTWEDAIRPYGTWAPGCKLYADGSGPVPSGPQQTPSARGHSVLHEPPDPLHKPCYRRCDTNDLREVFEPVRAILTPCHLSPPIVLSRQTAGLAAPVEPGALAESNGLGREGSDMESGSLAREFSRGEWSAQSGRRAYLVSIESLSVSKCGELSSIPFSIRLIEIHSDKANSGSNFTYSHSAD
jgi:hypothetical protein